MIRIRATITRGLEKFSRQVHKIIRLVHDDTSDRLARTAVMGLEILEATTRSTDSVDTGAYLISHMVYQDGRVLWSDPGINFGMSQVIPSRRRGGHPPIYEPTTAGRLETIKSNIKSVGTISFGNDRFYAAQLEYGSDSIVRPRYIYKLAMEELRSRIGELNTSEQLDTEARLGGSDAYG